MPNDSFLCMELKKVCLKFINYFFATGTRSTNKLDDGNDCIPGMHFLNFNTGIFDKTASSRSFF